MKGRKGERKTVTNNSGGKEQMQDTQTERPEEKKERQIDRESKRKETQIR